MKACSLNQTSCHSPQSQIGTVTLISQCHVLTYRQSRDRRLVYFRMGTFCDVGVAGGRPSCFGHGAVGVLPFTRCNDTVDAGESTKSSCFAEENLGEKIMPTECCVPLCTNKGGHTFPFNDGPRLKAWIVAVHRGEAKWQPSKHSIVCRAHFSDDDYTTLTYDGM